jgi:hypothetical protein
MTWDEGLYVAVGLIALRNIVKRKFSHNDWGHEFHPPIMMYLFGLSYSIYAFVKSVLKHKNFPNLNLLYDDAISLFEGYRSLLVMRLPSVILGSLSCVLTYLLAMVLFQSELIAVLAALFLALTPSFIGWSSTAMLENGVTFFCLLSALTFFMMIQYNSVGYLIISSVALGLALGSKETGFGTILAVIPWFLLVTSKMYLLAGLNWVIWAGVFVLSWFLLGFLVFYVTWPWLWGNPLGQFRKNLRAISTWVSPKGTNFKYYTLNLMASTPIPLAFLYVVGVFYSAYLMFEQANYLLLFAWIILPLGVLSLPFVIKRGGVAHVIFVLPPLSILASVGVYELSETIVKFSGWSLNGAAIFGYSSLETVFLILSIVFGGLIILECFNVNPYYIDYYNQIAKRIRKLKESLPIGIWGEGMAEAISYVEQQAPTGAEIWIYGPKIPAFYHSHRADLKKSTGNEPLFHLRSKADVEVPVEEMFYSWRTGDLTYYFPPYHIQEENAFNMEQLKASNITFIILYRSYTYDPSVSFLDLGNYKLVSLLRNSYSPVFTVKKKGIEFCWVYKINS